jgi:RNA polymerase sigma-70 factor (family 1)
MRSSVLKTEKKHKIASITSIVVNMDDDFSVFQKVKLGDEIAFELLFKKYYLSLCHYVFKYVENMTDAEELVQEALLGIWDKRESILITTSFKSYIYQSVKNGALNTIRKNQRRSNHLKILNPKTIESPQAIDNIHVEEINEKLFEVLESLPPKCRTIFQMSRMEGLKHKEIAIKMELKTKTIENQIGIALKILKEQLSDFLHIILLLISSINF